MIKDMEVECKTKFSMDVEFSFSFKRGDFSPDVFFETARWYGIMSCVMGWRGRNGAPGRG